MVETHYTYTLTGKGITITEHAPDARPPDQGMRSFTLYEESGEWLAECNFCGYPASTGKTRRTVSSKMWGSRDHRLCYRLPVSVDFKEGFHYTYTREQNGFSVQEHEPLDRPEYDGDESYTVYKEGEQWVADCNRCGNWAGFGSSHKGVVAHMFATHTSDWCDEHLYGLWHDRQRARLTSFA